MPTPRYCLSALHIPGNVEGRDLGSVLVVGGQSSVDFLTAAAELLCLRCHGIWHWHRLPPMLERRPYRPGMLTVTNSETSRYVIVSGGGPRSIEMLRLSHDHKAYIQWTGIDPLPEYFDTRHLLQFNGTIYAFGKLSKFLHFTVFIFQKAVSLASCRLGCVYLDW